jgi:hypothetical protein
MGMIDQRGQRRQVGGDGQRQAQGHGHAQGQLQGERGLSGEQRGIRLLTEDGGARLAVRIAPAAGRSHPITSGEADGDADVGVNSGAESAVPPAAAQGRVERPRRVRCDEMHAAAMAAAPATGGRVPGPLRARIAQRHARNA